MSELKLIVEKTTAAGMTYRQFEDEDGGNVTRTLTDPSGRELEFIDGVFFDRNNNVIYRGESGELCATDGHVWTFENARLLVDYTDKNGNRVKKQEALPPTGFLTKASAAFLAQWLETNFGEGLDYFVSLGQFDQTPAFQRYPQNQLYIIIVRKDGNGGVQVKRECAGLLVSATFLRYDMTYSRQYFAAMLNEQFDAALHEVAVGVLEGEPAAPLADAEPAAAGKKRGSKKG